MVTPLQMQTKKEQLARQQEVLKALGFYHGKIDGIWGPESIKAKQSFEGKKDFIPGIPNNGMPFFGAPPYPLGIQIGPDGLLQSEALNALNARKAKEKEKAAVMPKATDEVKDS